MNIRRYYHTIRHLKPVQIYSRLLTRLRPTFTAFRPAPPCRSRNHTWTPSVEKTTGLPERDRIHLFNQIVDVSTPQVWNSPSLSKLWLYHLHYFDHLSAHNVSERTAERDHLIRRWIDANTPATGPGWEPYPLSRRIVNWIKWDLSGHPLAGQVMDSLAVQIRVLRRRLEYHILGNHLLANAKALVFGGLFFRSEEADDWLKTGLEILRKELPEQILEDGGHFERSPMYHLLVMEDLMDLVNMGHVYEKETTARLETDMASWSDHILAMGRWLEIMCFPDRQITLMNDAAFNMAACPDALKDYGDRLGLVWPDRKPEILERLPESGYIRFNSPSFSAIIDVGPVGPDYLPAHAHADTLSFELCRHTRRLIVDTGVSCYGESAERAYERSTQAHNTVVIDGMNSSDVWAAFRVGRRAYPVDLRIDEENRSVSCGHTGYLHLPGQPLHRRTFYPGDTTLGIMDSVTGAGHHQIEASLHFHPSVAIKEKTSALFALEIDGQEIGQICFSGWPIIECRSGRYAPEFGKREPIFTLKTRSEGVLPFSARTRIEIISDP